MVPLTTLLLVVTRVSIIQAESESLVGGASLCDPSAKVAVQLSLWGVPLPGTELAPSSACSQGIQFAKPDKAVDRSDIRWLSEHLP